MGPYLTTPVTEKETEDNENKAVQYGACSMQGWRKSQEDTHIANISLKDGNMDFAVFDGHGGKEVSIYVEKVFVKMLTDLPEYKNGNYKESLTKCFKAIDTELCMPEGQMQLK